jgi:hypothetical protein
VVQGVDPEFKPQYHHKKKQQKKDSLLKGRRSCHMLHE